VHVTGSEQHRIHREYCEALDRGGDAVIPLGRDVLCDSCDTDLTDDPRTGGFMFGSFAYGPCCLHKLDRIRSYGEEDHIRAWCPEGVSFADWVRGMRGPDAAITVTNYYQPKPPEGGTP
jgi:hypothetical protein